jgi:UDP-N-acetylmuramoyl-tripeptide--D-alanyl-D-alanine ligase
VKHILGHILQTQAPTLITPGSVNTSMGITRIIRERLTEDHKYFIVEMGAYGVGSIASLCRLTPPDFGIITNIGHAHYERFKSLETVAQAKFELADAVIEKGTGKMVIHERTLRFPSVRAVKMDYPESFVVCGEPPEVDRHKQKDINYLERGDVHIIEVTQQANGLDIKIGIGDKTYNLNPPIYGLHHGHNVVLAAVMALELGVDINAIQLALHSLPQISHRLEVKPNHAEKYVIIDDSYNSNPLGFRSALDLMVLMATGGRKILITPGMIELGIAHDEAHAQIGSYAGQICDVAIIVRPSRIPTFVKAFKESGKTLVEVGSFQEASEWLEKNRQENDLVLIENDLPDMYERIPSM